MAAFCMLRNVHDILPDGRTAYEKRFNETFRGTIIPFGSAITYRPANPDIIAQMAKMGQKTREALFMGYEQHHGGGYTDRVWILDALKLTNAETTDEVSSDRVAEAEITVVKDEQGNYISQ